MKLIKYLFILLALPMFANANEVYRDNEPKEIYNISIDVRAPLQEAYVSLEISFKGTGPCSIPVSTVADAVALRDQIKRASKVIFTSINGAVNRCGTVRIIQ